MSAQDVTDGGPTFDRIGKACDRIAHAGHGVTATHAARDLMDFADAVERLADVLERAQ